MILIQHTKLPSKFDHDVIKLTVIIIISKLKNANVVVIKAHY